MDIEKLLTKSSPPPRPSLQLQPKHHEPSSSSIPEQHLIHEERLMKVWEQQLYKGGFVLESACERNTLTDCYISRTSKRSTTSYQSSSSPSSHLNNSSSSTKTNNLGQATPIHVKIIGRHMNGSFRCHIGTGKQSRPIQTTELSRQMRMMVVFFRVENRKSPEVMTDFLFFPTWLLHLFRYAHHGNTPGRTDVRFLENAALAKEDHIYRLNHVLNSLFRFQLYCLDYDQLAASIQLANYLFDIAGLDPMTLPRPHISLHHQHDNDNSNTPSSPCDHLASKRQMQHHQHTQPSLYASLILLLHAPRPSKIKTMCTNCNTKPSSRRQLCVACYRYQLKHNEPRPLRLIVANRPGPRSLSPPSHHASSPLSSPPTHSFSASRLSTDSTPLSPISPTTSTSSFSSSILAAANYRDPGKKKASNKCVNCGVTETHQWYRNLCGQGHWCETCKSYYLRHGKVRPAELFVKAAKRKVDVRSWMDWTSWCLDDATVATATMAINKESQQRRWSSLVSATNSDQLLSPSSSQLSSPPPTRSSIMEPPKYSDYGLTRARTLHTPTTTVSSPSFHARSSVRLQPPRSQHDSSTKPHNRYSMPLFGSSSPPLSFSALSSSSTSGYGRTKNIENRHSSLIYSKPCRTNSSYLMDYQHQRHHNQ
ncbi:hypothetical protein [Absidia glauca]|uniref:GATA-type domain-containing protein n=1 Tax=Absidia glauca TaxID=4829 RepID=A0A168LTI9_ABSGL|nr:hypothetical protein [Absidia glauca]